MRFLGGHALGSRGKLTRQVLKWTMVLFVEQGGQVLHLVVFSSYSSQRLDVPGSRHRLLSYHQACLEGANGLCELLAPLVPLLGERETGKAGFECAALLPLTGDK